MRFLRYALCHTPQGIGSSLVILLVPVLACERAEGFALLPIRFHPFHQDAANFRYLGRQTLNNRDTYIVSFVQDPHKAELLGVVRVNGTDVTVAYQGIAWIDPDTFQITQMRVGFLKARPEVGGKNDRNTVQQRAVSGSR